MYVLDTNALSALMRGNEAFLQRLADTDKQNVVVPQPVLAEIAYGIERLPRSKRKERLRQRFALVRDELARSLWTDEVSDCFGVIKARLERRGQRIEDFDAAVAAHAREADSILVTADRAHMPRVDGLRIEDWTVEPYGSSSAAESKLAHVPSSGRCRPRGHASEYYDDSTG